MKKLTMILILIACIGCDQGTKYAAKYFLGGRPTLSYIGDILRLNYTENRGAFLGLGAGLPENIRQGLLIVMVSIFLFGFFLFLILNRSINLLAVSGSTLIIGGGAGNLVDRLKHQGAVIDFMSIGLGPIRTGIFNIADLAIMVGVFLFTLFIIQRSRLKGRGRIRESR
jgi:signal peptidase II